jgi:CheY-like chemotaxis protein
MHVSGPSSHPQHAAATRLTVLLTNEQEAWHHTVRQLLAPQGINLLAARTGREALQLLESTTIHVAVLDHRLPQLGGLQVIKLVREHLQSRPPLQSPTPQSPTTTPTLPATILLADHLTNSLLHDALGMSIFTVLTKPVNHDQLLDALARAMRRYHNSQWPTPPHHPTPPHGN